MPEIPHLVAKLKVEGEKQLDFFSMLADDQWRVEVYTEGGLWTIRNILAHFVSAERAFVMQLFPNVLSGGGGAPEDFSIDRYNVRQQEKTRELTPRELVDRFKEVREKMIDWVSRLQEDDLMKTGRHPFLGMTTLFEMIKMVYIHNQIHLRDVRKALENNPG